MSGKTTPTTLHLDKGPKLVLALFQEMAQVHSNLDEQAVTTDLDWIECSSTWGMTMGNIFGPGPF